jgi:hypothetical protein
MKNDQFQKIREWLGNTLGGPIQTSEIQRLVDAYDTLERELIAAMDACPGAVRVCEGGGPENLAASVAVNLARLKRADDRIRTAEETKLKIQMLDQAARRSVGKFVIFQNVPRAGGFAVEEYWGGSTGPGRCFSRPTPDNAFKFATRELAQQQLDSFRVEDFYYGADIKELQ